MMDAWHLAHLLVLGLWGGLILGESVLEVVGLRDDAHAAFAASVHYWIDLCVEIPLLTGVVVTGAVLMSRVELTGLHGLKIALGLGAVGINLWCVGVVLRRRAAAERGDAPEEVRDGARLVFLAIKLGLPMGLAALALGFRLLQL